MSIAHQKYLYAIKTKLEQQLQGTEAYKSEHVARESPLIGADYHNPPRTLQ